ncbi:MAG: hypothetical protein Q7S33_01350 [Nanoarchaeota archaeon]|nr:hypothetical protein [Nanoarchaeota archaeon]
MINYSSTVEKNLRRSFGYVKKDLIMANESITNLHTEIQHLSLNQASLLNEIEKLREEIREFTNESKFSRKNNSNSKPIPVSKKKKR